MPGYPPALIAYPFAMMVGLLGWVTRRRVAALTVALVSAVILRVVPQITEIDHAWPLSLTVGVLLPFALLLWSAAHVRSFHPATLVARPEVPALEVPANPGVVLGAAGYTFLVVNVLDGWVRDIAAGTDLWFSVCVVVLSTALLVTFWRAALGRLGVRLSPDGIDDRQMFGSLFIPWDALATPFPAYPYDTQQITLVLASPELVRRRGLRRGDPTLLQAAGVNAELLARAIHEYANRAALRPSIGSEAELDRFQAIPQIVDLTSRD